MIETKRQGAVDVISGAERLTGEGVAELAEVFDDLPQRGQPQVVLDLNGVVLLDSGALELLLDTRDRFVRKGGSLKLAGASPLCSEILKITGVATRLDVFPDTAAAVRSYVM